MAARIKKDLLDQCPTPGHPSGCDFPLDQRIWWGWQNRRDIEVYEVRFWMSPEQQAAGVAPVVMRVDPKASEFLAIKAASDNAPEWFLDGLRTMQDKGKSAREIVKELRAQTKVVIEIDAGTTIYTKKTGGGALYRKLWEAGITLAVLVCDLDSGGQPGELERKARGKHAGPNDIETLTARRLLDRRPQKAGLQWFESLDDRGRQAAAKAIIRRTATLVSNPPEWRLLAGTVRRCAHFVRRNEWTGSREPRPTLSWSKKRTACLDVLAKWWLGPDTDLAHATGTTPSGQLAMATEAWL